MLTIYIPVTRLGYYLPWALFAAATATIGTGLCSTLSPSSTVAQWVGYQILFGIGRGAYMQIVRKSPPPRSHHPSTKSHPH